MTSWTSLLMSQTGSKANPTKALPNVWQAGELKSKGTSIGILDEKYPKVYSKQPNITIPFSVQDEPYFKEEWHRLFRDLNQFLKNKGFEWPDPYVLYTRIYFNKSGYIEYVVYQYGDNSVPAHDKQFKGLVQQFALQWKCMLKANRPFSQNGSYIVKEPDEE